MAPIDLMMSKFHTESLVIQTIRAIISPGTLRIVYFVYKHSISYGIFFCGNQPHSNKIFKIQRRTIRNITNSRMRDSCWELLRKIGILPLYSQYNISLLIFVIKNIYFMQIIRSTVYNLDFKQLTSIHS